MRKNSAALGREAPLVMVTPFMFPNMFRAMSAAFREPPAPFPEPPAPFPEPPAPLLDGTREGVLGDVGLRVGSEYGMTFIKLRIRGELIGRVGDRNFLLAAAKNGSASN
jgi:hypothetical protein